MVRKQQIEQPESFLGGVNEDKAPNASLPDAATLHKEPPESEAHFDATRMYLNEIGFSPLLTAEEEVHYECLASQTP